MAICQRCKKSLGFREKRFVVAGLVYCLPCMTCSSCRSPADGSPRVVYADQVLCGKCNQSRLQPIKEKMIDQVLQLSLPNPLGTRFLMDSGEIVKTHYTAIRMFKVGPMDFKSEGTFMITNRRIIYLQTRFSPVTVTQVTD